MATRYNAFGWYNPYGKLAMPNTGVAQFSNLDGGVQPLRGLMFPLTPALVVEPQKPSEVQVTPKVEQKVTATAEKSSQSKEDDTFSPADRKKLRTYGGAASIMAAFASGVVVCFIILGSNTFSSQVPTACLSLIISKEFQYFILGSTIPSPICMFIIGLLCLNVKKEFGNEGKALYGLSIFELVLLVPLFLFGGIAGTFQAYTNCQSGILIVLIILPIIIIVMAVAFFIILLFILRLLTKKAKAKPTKTPETTPSQPSATPAAPTPAPAPVQPAPAPAPNPTPVAPAPVPPQVPALQPTQPQQPNFNLPTQPGFPYARGPFQPGLYRPTNFPPPPIFAPSPYGRPPFRPPYGYSPYRNAPPYRPLRGTRRQY